MPTYLNPHFPKDEWEQIVKELGEENPVFKQEFLGEFIDDIGAVFKGIHTCIDGDFEPPLPNVKYSIGIDLAKTTDYTVKFVIRHDTRHIVYMERYNQVPYDEQINKIISLSKRYNNANILVDSTGVGDPVYDLLKKNGANVRPFKFTNPSKENLIRGLIIALENKEITYPKIDVLITELEMFEYSLGSTGVMRYNAPEGEHDDCVIALALAIKAVEENYTGILDFYKGINEKEETKHNIQNFQQLVY
jgi:phage FluMu gp28-like protein